MIIHRTTPMGNPLRQGSAEWLDMRHGIPTCSRLSRILTPATLAYSKGASKFAAELIGERMLGVPLDGYEGNQWTDRGTDVEEEARLWYEFHCDVEVDRAPFVTTTVARTDEDGAPVPDGEGGWITDTVGCSPDGLVGYDGMIEIKVRSAAHHMHCITGADEIASRLQTQGGLWVTGREWCDSIAYHSILPKKIVRQHKDDEVQTAITLHMARFFREMAIAERKLLECGDVIEDDGLLTALIASVKAGKS